MTRRDWPNRLRMARVDDSPSWYVSCCDTPPQPGDREYVLAEWIWCDDRLPEPFDYVLCLVQAKYDANKRFCDTGFYNGDEWDICDAIEPIVLAWQPLPPLPTAEQIAGYYTRTEGAP